MKKKYQDSFRFVVCGVIVDKLCDFFDEPYTKDNFR